MSEYKLMPVEPTEEMLEAACRVTRPCYRQFPITLAQLIREEYKAMIEAAPPITPDPPEGL